MRSLGRRFIFTTLLASIGSSLAVNQLTLTQKSVVGITASASGKWLKDGQTLITQDGSDIVFASAYEKENILTLRNICDSKIDEFAISSDEDLLAVSCQGEYKVKLINAKNGEELYSFSVKDGSEETESLAFDPNGRFLAVGTIGNVVVYQLSDLRPVRQFKEGSLDLEWSRDGKYIYSWIYSGAYIFDFVNDKIRYEFRLESSANSMSVSHDGLNITFPTDSGVQVFDISDGKIDEIVNIKTESSVDSAIYIPSAQTVLIGDGNTLRAVNSNDGIVYATYKPPTVTYNITLSPDSDVLFMGGSLFWSGDDLISDYLREISDKFFLNKPGIDKNLAKLNVICNLGKLGSIPCLKARQIIESNSPASNLTLSNWLSGKISDDAFVKSFK